MEKLKLDQFNISEISSDDLSEINGGNWFTDLITKGTGATVFAVIGAVDVLVDAVKGFSAGYNYGRSLNTN